MSRADKTLSKITYEITLDDENKRVTQLKVTTLCAMKTNGRSNRKTAFTSDEHVAFVATYRFSARNSASKPSVPGQAARLLK